MTRSTRNPSPNAFRLLARKAHRPEALVKGSGAFGGSRSSRPAAAKPRRLADNADSLSRGSTLIRSDSAGAQRMDADNGKDERTWHLLA